MTLPEACSILELDPSATEAEALQSYRELVRVWHPDNFTSKPDLQHRAHAKTTALNQAWEVFQRDHGRPLPPVAPRGRAISPLGRAGALVLAGALGMALATLGFLVSDLLDPGMRLAKELARMSYLANQNLPTPMDEETEFTATYAGPGRRFTSIYTLTGVTKEQVGPGYFDQIRPALVHHVRTKLDSDPTMRLIEAEGITLAFSFRDRHGADVVTLDVTPQDYRGP